MTGVRIVKNRIENGRAVPTGEEEVIACGLVLRSIGYRGVPLAGIPFDERRGLISNLGGRVLSESGEHEIGEYVVGWVKRGPSGVIGTNKKDAADTVARVLEDREAGKLNEPTDADPEACEQWLAEQCPGLVTWEGWRAIDVHETGLGEPQGRPRVKLVRTRRDDRHRLQRQGVSTFTRAGGNTAVPAAGISRRHPTRRHPMRRIAIVAATIAAIAGGTAAFAADPAPTTPGPAPDPLLGTWALVMDGDVRRPGGHRRRLRPRRRRRRGRRRGKHVGRDACRAVHDRDRHRHEPRLRPVAQRLAGRHAARHRMQLVRIDGPVVRARARRRDCCARSACPKLDARPRKGRVHDALASRAERIRYASLGAQAAMERPTPITAFELQVGAQRIDVTLGRPVDRRSPRRGRTSAARATTRPLPPARPSSACCRCACPRRARSRRMDPWLQSFLVQGKSGQDYEQSAVLTPRRPQAHVRPHRPGPWRPRAACRRRPHATRSTWSARRPALR